jgi:23S rRNA (adenine2503-C2)-methyltransferase
MKVIATTGREDVAIVYIAEYERGKMVECVESVQPPLPREQKWVLLVSTMFGCPVGCQMCDAGGSYHGKLSKEQIFDQIDFMVSQRFPSGHIPSQQFKIQFARMGEPSLNPGVLDVLDELPRRYLAPGLMPSVSTIAPSGTKRFFDRLMDIKQEKFAKGHFQFQFSLHSTDAAKRDELIPVKKWSFAEMADYGERFYSPGDRKITLNFALARGVPVDPVVLRAYFDPARFLIKITPLNPTYKATENRLLSYVDPLQGTDGGQIVRALQEAGYDVIVSIGELEENQIGSNCGQYLRTHLDAESKIEEGYTYCVREFA